MDIFPHPDDIIIDDSTGEITFDGPMSKEQAGARKAVREQAIQSMRRYFEVKEALAKEPTNRALRREFKDLKKIYEFLKEDSERMQRHKALRVSRRALETKHPSQIRRFPDQSRMNKLKRDSLREGLKGKGRSRRKAVLRHAEAEKASRPRRNDILPSLKIEPYAVDALKSQSRKLRKSDPAHVRDIANSISTLGFNVPILIGKDNVVVDGNSRLEAAKMLGLLSVPCLRVDHLDETEQRLLRLAVNRLGEKGFWDVGELEAEFKELIIADAPIEISGFGSDEIDQVVIGGNKDGCEAGDLAPLPGVSASARVGDLFRLGSHLLLCGDATDPAVVRRLMRTDVARIVLTDEPFKVSIGGQLTAGEHREEISEAQFLDFNQKWIKAVLPHLGEGGILGTFIDWRGLPIAHSAATGLGLTPLDLVVWAKTNAGIGQSLPIPARVTTAFQERRRRKRQQHLAWQARTASHQRMDLSRCLLCWIRRKERSRRSSDGETNRHAAGCADRPFKPWRNCSRSLPRRRDYSFRRREYRAGVPRHRA